MAHIQNLFCSEEFDVEEVSKPVAPVPHYQTNICVKAIPDPVLTNDPRVVEVMLGQEETRKIDYLATMQPELRPHMRRIVTDWMLEVCEDQDAGTEVFLLAVHYLDTFLSSTTIRKSQFQLAAATCLLLASKFNAVVPISADQLVLYTDYSITKEELVAWELMVLSALHWELSAPTSHTFLHQLIAKLRNLNMLTGSQVSQLDRHARTLATLAATEHAFLLTRPSVVAGGALIAAFRGLQLGGNPELVLQLTLLLQCPQEVLLSSAATLDALVDSSRPSKPLPEACSTPMSTPCMSRESEGSRTPTDCHLVVV